MARNLQKMIFQSNFRGVGGHASVDLALTDDAATTAVVQMAGGPFGRIRNTSGGAVTITFYDATSAEGTALAVLDEDNVAISDFVVANNSSRKLPEGLAGVEYLILKASAATPTVSLHLER
jgi:hypothetical protein